MTLQGAVLLDRISDQMKGTAAARWPVRRTWATRAMPAGRESSGRRPHPLLYVRSPAHGAFSPVGIAATLQAPLLITTARERGAGRPGEAGPGKGGERGMGATGSGWRVCHGSRDPLVACRAATMLAVPVGCACGGQARGWAGDSRLPHHSIRPRRQTAQARHSTVLSPGPGGGAAHARGISPAPRRPRSPLAHSMGAPPPPGRRSRLPPAGGNRRRAESVGPIATCSSRPPQGREPGRTGRRPFRPSHRRCACVNLIKWAESACHGFRFLLPSYAQSALGPRQRLTDLGGAARSKPPSCRCPDRLRHALPQ